MHSLTDTINIILRSLTRSSTIILNREHFYVLYHELEVPSKPAVIPISTVIVGGGPFAVIFLLEAVAGDHEVAAETYQVEFRSRKCLV